MREIDGSSPKAIHNSPFCGRGVAPRQILEHYGCRNEDLNAVGSMDFETLARIRLRKGAGGGDPHNGLCVMELVSWISGDDRTTDQPSCASPHLTAFAIALNDSASSWQVRDSMKPLAFLLVDTRDPWRERQRSAYLLRESARRLLAPLLSEVSLDLAADRLGKARTRHELRRAARSAEEALSNVGRSSTWANARAATAHLAEAASGDHSKAPLALGDSLYCALTALDDADAKLALWRDAHAILCAAIKMGKYHDLKGLNSERLDQPKAVVPAH